MRIPVAEANINSSGTEFISEILIPFSNERDSYNKIIIIQYSSELTTPTASSSLISSSSSGVGSTSVTFAGATNP